jgi:2-aminoadipate transaminase
MSAAKFSSAMRADSAPPPMPVAIQDTTRIVLGGGIPDPTLVPVDELEKALSDVLAHRSSQTLSYSRGLGEGSLRSEVAKWMVRQHGGHTTADDLFTTAGSSGAIHYAARALVDPGDVVIAEELSYPAALALFRQFGAQVVPTRLDRDGVVVEALEETLRDLAQRGAPVKALYTISDFHSPTTATLSIERRQAIVELAERYDFYVVQDNTYGDIRFEDRLIPSFPVLAPERGLLAGSFSKTITPALRLGWLMAPRPILDVLAGHRADLGVSRLLQDAVARLMADGFFAEHVRRSNDVYRAKRDAVLATLAATCGEVAEWTEPTGGFFVWVRHGEIPAAAVAAAATEEGVGYYEGAFYGVSEPVRSENVNAMRVAFGETSMADIVEGTARLGRAIQRAAITSPH